ncbi:GTPase [Umezawaea endophytica]|uniref:50S ribosome-binding GTPase n=1 Tax=Umezawaea endophytica TaxID=1654476 RepID=A0A9X2VJ62_9PSEU|nr:GTPase [Umezawaea endophytica]MCS7477477.1 50S ribosome-binding GTPase [Umezawaea endophytica]
MTAPLVTCPTCQDQFPWVEDQLLRWSPRDGRFLPVEPVDTTNPIKLADQRASCYIRCPNPSQDTPQHYTPVVLGQSPAPVVIGLVGRPRAGKSHLLAAMVQGLVTGRANALGVTARPGDGVQHAAFHRGHIEPMLRGESLDGTGDGVVGYADFLLVRSPTGERPVIFFDTGGENFRAMAHNSLRSRFLLNTNALMFVEDADQVMARTAGGNEWISDALARLGVVPHLRSIPSTVVLMKSDQLRYTHPVDRWLRLPDDRGPLVANDFLTESRDVYAVLDQYGANFARDLYDRFDRCTMHFVSATGVAAEDERYPRGVHPMRVLRPLVALLAMTGVLTGPEAAQVGR